MTEGTPVQRGTETVLIADDNKDIRKLSKDILEQFGYTVIEAEDGQEAIDKFKEHTDTISLLLLDIIMPKKNGKDVYEEVKVMKPEMKVIFLSGLSEDLIRTEGILGEGLHIIVKPVSIHELLIKVREVLDT
jgi:DNA-binding response OmpR family regulator